MVSLDITGFSPNPMVDMYRLFEPFTDRIVRDAPATNGATSFDVIVPPWSATLLVLTGPTADDDGDNMPTRWEQLYTNATEAGATPMQPYTPDADEDGDGDGASNLEEYHAGTDPTDSASVFKIHYTAAAYTNLFSCPPFSRER